MIDFDKKFQDYFEKWVADNAGEYTYDEMEDKIPEIYDAWLNAPDADLDGKTVEEYVLDMSPEQLIAEFLSAFLEGGQPGTVILDRIEEVSGCVPSLIDILSSDNCDEARISAANLIHEMGEEEQALNEFVFWLFSYDVSEDLKDVAVEILSEHADKVKASIFENIDETTPPLIKTLAVEILINAEKDEKTFALLCELFESGENLALHAGYLAKYGDERAATILYKALDGCNYLDFTEIRNAIETLGGVVDDDFRDFTEDEYYKAIKNLK